MKRWSQEEVNTALEIIADNYTNLSRAFQIISDKTGRSKKAVNVAWYSSKGVLYKAKKNNVVFMIVRDGNKLVNSKRKCCNKPLQKVKINDVSHCKSGGYSIFTYLSNLFRHH